MGVIDPAYFLCLSGASLIHASMPAVSASAPGKIILFGEHAVVYGRPAIAVPVFQVQAKAIAMADPRGPAGRVHLQAPQIGLEADLDDLPPVDPLGLAVRSVASALGIARFPALSLRVTSTIPVAAGLGSSAAVTAAVIRVLSAFLGHPLPDQQVSELVYEVEKLHHGTPSGIDNTVVTFARPIFFRRGQPVQVFRVGTPFSIVIGDTGVSSPTSATVSDVQRAWQREPQPYEELFDAIGSLTQAARRAIESGHPMELGPLMDENQALLRELGVSSMELDRLVSAAQSAGALGAKLCGGGRGGNMIALSPPGRETAIEKALREAGASHTIVTVVKE
jgi:mevalonate kinase